MSHCTFKWFDMWSTTFIISFIFEMKVNYPVSGPCLPELLCWHEVLIHHTIFRTQWRQCFVSAGIRKGRCQAVLSRRPHPTILLVHENKDLFVDWLTVLICRQVIRFFYGCDESRSPFSSNWCYWPSVLLTAFVIRTFDLLILSQCICESTDNIKESMLGIV